MVKNFLFALVALLFCGFATNVFACTCGETTVEESKSIAQVVFLGRIKNKVKSDAVGKNGAEVTFTGERGWKGQIRKDVKVYSGATRDLYEFIDLCSPEFKIGNRYVVFATGEKLLVRLACSHTTLIPRGGKNHVTQQLGKGSRPKS